MLLYPVKGAPAGEDFGHPDWVPVSDLVPIEASSKEGWRHFQTPHSEAEFRWESDRVRSGDLALYLRNKGPRTAGWATDIPIVAGAEYRVVVHTWTKNNRGTTVISARGRGETGDWVSGALFDSKAQEVFATESTSGWEKLDARFTFPDGTVEAVLMLSNLLGKGDEVWFDDIEVYDNVVSSYLSEMPAILRDLSGHASLMSAEENASVRRMEEWLQRLKTIERARYAAMPVETRREIFGRLREGAGLRARLLRQADAARWIEEGEPACLLWVDAMERVFLKDAPLPPSTSREARLELFRGQREAIQAVILTAEKLSGIQVNVGKSADFLGVVETRVVGNVNIEQPAINYHRKDPFPHKGWWPDPLFVMEGFDSDAGSAQAIWVDVRVPREQKPGEYTIPISVRANGGEINLSQSLSVHVFPGELPAKWHMKNIFSFSTRTARDWSNKRGRFAYGDRWPEVAPAFYRMLMDSRISPFGSLYENIDDYPEDAVLKAVGEGMNVLLFAVLERATYDKNGRQVLKKDAQETLRKVNTRLVPWLKKHGLMNRAYLYCFDEHSPEFFDFAVEVLKPYSGKGFKILTTMQDPSYGTRSSLGEVVDAFMPNVNLYDLKLARKARQEGREVWWYSAGDFNIETDPVYQRLRAWRTFEQEVDGYLIWTMNRWAGNSEPIQPAVRTRWNAALDGVTPSSSAMMIYPGQDGPVSSIRLENYRMGIEDYDLLMGAALHLKREGESQPEAVRRLLQMLELPGEAGGLTPADIRKARRRIARILQEHS